MFRCEAISVYPKFKSLMTRVCLKLFLDLNEDDAEKLKEISELATKHWHG